MKTEAKMEPGNNYKNWTKKEKKILKMLTKEGKSIKEMAQILGRTRDAVSYQKNVLGYRTPGYPVRVKKVENVMPASAPAPKIQNTAPKIQSTATRDQARDMARAAREIARANGKRITMAMFFVEEL